MSDVSAAMRRLNVSAETKRLSLQFTTLCRALLVGKGLAEARSILEHNFGHMSDALVCLRTAVAAGSMSTDAAIAQLRPLANAFIASNAFPGVMDAVLAGGATPVPLQTSIVSVSTIGSATVDGEAMVEPMTQLGFATNNVSPVVAIAIVAFNEWVKRYSLPGADELIQSELGKAVTAATDTTFLAGLYALTSPTASAGATAANIQTDIKTLLNGLTLGGNSRLFLIGSPENILGIAQAADTSGPRLWPQVGITGGTMMPGLIAIPSANLASGAVLMIDASGLAMNAGGLKVDVATHADLQFSGSPDSPPTASTVRISLFQSGMVALKATRDFGYSAARSGSLTSLSGCNWGS